MLCRHSITYLFPSSAGGESGLEMVDKTCVYSCQLSGVDAIATVKLLLDSYLDVSLCPLSFGCIRFLGGIVKDCIGLKGILRDF